MRHLVDYEEAIRKITTTTCFSKIVIFERVVWLVFAKVKIITVKYLDFNKSKHVGCIRF